MIEVNFPAGAESVTVDGLWQYDYGQELLMTGLGVPSTVMVDFSLREHKGETISRAAFTAEDGVTHCMIPNELMKGEGFCDDYRIFAFVYVTDSEQGETVKKIKLKVHTRPMPDGLRIPADGPSFEYVIGQVRRIADEAIAAMEGAGSSSGSSEGSATLARRYAEEAARSAGQSAGSASEASGHAADARLQVELATTVKTETEEVLAQAVTVKQETEQIRSGAQAQAESAIGSAATAQRYAQDAANQASAAKLSAKDAYRYAGDAERIHTAIQDDKVVVDNRVQQASSEAQRARTHAQDAAASAELADDYQASAAQSANRASSMATSAQNYMNSAKTYMNSANAYSNDSKGYASSANIYQTNAKTYADRAQKALTDLENGIKNGDFDGKDYVFTEEDKDEIVERINREIVVVDEEPTAETIIALDTREAENVEIPSMADFMVLSDKVDRICRILGLE